MKHQRIEQVAENAFAVPSYSLQTITPNFNLHGTVQVLGTVEEDDQQTDGEPEISNPLVK